MLIDNKTIMVTGGTGTFGKGFIKSILKKYNPQAIRVYSRDELKQKNMAEELDDKRLRFFIGDIRDKERLNRAMKGVDIVIHAAALKQVPICEYNPVEAVKTNIQGTVNIIETAIDNNIEKALMLSTDKAVYPVNLYGATKLVAEKIFIQGNVWRGKKGTIFSCTRYGNVMGSRGSVIPLFLKQKKEGVITITDLNMTRFWITLEQAVNFIISCLDRMKGGEIFIPKIPSIKVIDLARAIAPEAKIKIIGIRSGEKLHETLITIEEAKHTIEFDDYFIIEPEFQYWGENNYGGGKRLSDNFQYTSNNNQWLTKEELYKLLKEVQNDNIWASVDR